MNNTIKILALIACSTFAHASVTLSPAAENIQDAGGNPVGAGNLALIVVSTNDNDFGMIKEGGLSLNVSAGGMGFIDDNDDAVIQHFATTVNGFTSIQEAVSPGISLDLDSRFTPGDKFAIYWFPTVAYDSDIANIVLSAGDSYGIVSSGQVRRDGSVEGDGVKDWVLPDDGNSPSHLNSAPGIANLEVQPVPEPTSLALLGLGTLGLITRRRRA